MTKTNRTATTQPIAYTPDQWNEAQRELHTATTLEIAFHHASCLAGGWYRRPVTIDMRITVDNTEEYQMRPADCAPDAGWQAIYTVAAH